MRELVKSQPWLVRPHCLRPSAVSVNPTMLTVAGAVPASTVAFDVQSIHVVASVPAVAGVLEPFQNR